MRSVQRVVLGLLTAALTASAQKQMGELRLQIFDATGAPLPAQVSVVSLSNQVQISGPASPGGRWSARLLPFGSYRLRVEMAAFIPLEEILEIRSEVPLERRVTLGVAPVETQVQVRDFDTLLPSSPGWKQQIGRETLESHRAAQPSRAVLQLVNTQPGWLLEANGVLHPRGSEYDTQYVIDGIPILDNRSPAFAPAFEVEELESMTVRTGGYPAEYGRKLGGVVELVTWRDERAGLHGRLMTQGGSFGTGLGHAALQYRLGRVTAGFSSQGAFTNRFLDPPVEHNFTNRATGGGATGRLEIEATDNDRLRFYVHQKRTGFLVPNEALQQAAGQRQDRTNHESLGSVSWQRVLSPRWLLDARGMGREVSAALWSNSLSTPILADQDRAMREAYGAVSASSSFGRHAVKFGFETSQTALRERFGYQITDPSYFLEDGELEFPVNFRFLGRRRGSEAGAYVQDTIRAGAFTLNAGLRWDRYSLLVKENYVSPRAGIAWNWDAAGLVLRANYDRAVTTPAVENLLLASSQEAWQLTEETTGLPLRPARGNFYEAGFSKRLAGRLRLDGAVYRRDIRDFADDDVFLNTGVSFPISFDRARIQGVEAKLELPEWRGVTGFISYSNLSGTGFLPLTGGLFLEEDSAELLASRDSFRITQDQRNTVQTRFRYQFHRRAWAAAGFWYNSGLPFERESDDEFDDLDQLRERFGQRVLDQVSIPRGRVRPSHSIDLSAGVEIWREEGRSATLQADLLNTANRLNLINFAGLFSGTAIGIPRMFSLRLDIKF